MNKTELVAELAKEKELKKTEAAVIVDGVFDIITEALVKGDKVSIAGFGSLETVDTKARTGRNPKTGEPVAIPAKKKVKWAALGALKKAVNA